MSGTRNDRFHGTLHSLWLPDRRLALQWGALTLVLWAALISAGCGTQAGGGSTPQSLSLSGTLPAGAVNQTYNAVLNVSGGSAPYHFAVKSGTLPVGLSLNPSTGSISGTPESAGPYSFEIVVTDPPLPDQGVRTFSLHVALGNSVRVNVSPASVTVVAGQKQQFTAAVSGTSNTAVTWSASAGSIDAQGLYTAPSNPQTNVTVTAASQADPSRSAYSSVIVDKSNSQPLTITNGSLPQGQQGNSYSTTFTATGGTLPYSWSVAAGSPPPGITLSSDGQFAGLPFAAGSSSFTVSVKDSAGLSSQHGFSVEIASGGNFDGPAELPRVTVSSAMSATPATGSVISVKAGGDLQAALNNAQCGNTIELQAGATFTGPFNFPAKNCDNSHWIVLRTSSPDSALPAEGQRLTPCYAGVSSLPGRPQYPCSNPQNVLPKLIVSGSQDVLIIFQPGANHYRLLGLEVTRPTGAKGAPTLITVEHGGTANNIVIDRSWVHGTKQDDTRNGVELAGGTYMAVVDSYFSDFHCTAGTGACTDSHAVAGGMGDFQDGAYEIRNNFLEASGEAVMFGGAEATTTPTDITIHFNHFFKPWQWMQGSSPFQGGDSGNPFIVKNHLEFKNAARVLVEANLMENVWGGFTQTGFGILVTPKNQHNQNGNMCSICEVTDVTIRYTRISHGGGGIAMATVTPVNVGGAPAKAGTRFSIHDVVIDDISRKYTGGLGRLFMLVNGWPQNPLNTVTINHITGFPDANGGVLIVGNKTTNPPMYGFVFTNNLITTGQYPVWNSGSDESCAASTVVPVTIINRCFTTNTFSNNALIAAPSPYPPSSWPANNRFAPSVTSARFVDYADGNGGNYELQSGSPYKNMGSDGKDLGADIAGLNAMLATVE